MAAKHPLRVLVSELQSLDKQLEAGAVGQADAWLVAARLVRDCFYVDHPDLLSKKAVGLITRALMPDSTEEGELYLFNPLPHAFTINAAGEQVDVPDAPPVVLRVPRSTLGWAPKRVPADQVLRLRLHRTKLGDLIGEVQAALPVKPRPRFAPCSHCGGKMKSASSPKGIRKLKCTDCGECRPETR